MNIEGLNKTLKSILSDIPDNICFRGYEIKNNEFIVDHRTPGYCLHIPFITSMKIDQLEVQKNNEKQLKCLIRSRLIDNLSEIIDLYTELKEALEKN